MLQTAQFDASINLFCLVLLTLELSFAVFYLEFPTIPAAIAQNFNLTAELAIPTGAPTIEAQPLTAKIRIRKGSK